MNEAQISFLKKDLVPLLQKIPFDKKPEWGAMTVHHMIEHLSEVLRYSSGKLSNQKIVIPEEKIPAAQAFLMSDKPFPTGVVNPLFPKDPSPVKIGSIDAALKELQGEIDYYLTVLNSNNEFTITHPYFGKLTTEMNLQAYYKHAVHHLRQFGVEAAQA